MGLMKGVQEGERGRKGRGCRIRRVAVVVVQACHQQAVRLVPLHQRRLQSTTVFRGQVVARSMQQRGWYTRAVIAVLQQQA